MPFDKELAALLACPKCHGPVRLLEDESGFACGTCHLLFSVDDGIPNFLIDEAKPLAGGPWRGIFEGRFLAAWGGDH
jgi:uncharacterized protein YbaR (Trm112 family)